MSLFKGNRHGVKRWKEKTDWWKRYIKCSPLSRKAVFLFTAKNLHLQGCHKNCLREGKHTSEHRQHKVVPHLFVGYDFFAISYLESGGRLMHRAPTITPNMSNKHFQTSTHRCFISHPASWKIFFTNHKTSFKSSAATKMTGNRYISNNNSNIRLHFSEYQASKQGCLSP